MGLLDIEDIATASAELIGHQAPESDIAKVKIHKCKGSNNKLKKEQTVTDDMVKDKGEFNIYPHFRKTVLYLKVFDF
jgi:hypothetical protein